MADGTVIRLPLVVFRLFWWFLRSTVIVTASPRYVLTRWVCHVAISHHHTTTFRCRVTLIRSVVVTVHTIYDSLNLLPMIWNPHSLLLPRYRWCYIVVQHLIRCYWYEFLEDFVRLPHDSPDHGYLHYYNLTIPCSITLSRSTCDTITFTTYPHRPAMTLFPFPTRLPAFVVGYIRWLRWRCLV